MSRLTFTMIKPEAVEAGNSGNILSKIEKAGFRAKRSLDLGIKELIKYYSFITKKNSNI